MQQTKTLKLNIIEGSDTVDPAPINQNMEALEAETQAIRTAFTAADTAIRTDFAAADTTLRTDFTAADTSMAAQISALAANLGSVGQNARIVTGSYTGTGTSGSANPNTLTFDFKPIWIHIVCGSENSAPCADLLRPSMTAYSGGNLRVTWEDYGVSWYTTETIVPASPQLNYSNKIYYYAAIGVDG